MMTFIPMILVSGPLAGFLLGKWLDLKFKTGQAPTVALLILGFLAGVRESIRIIQKVSREQK
ncbi:MAG: AtpZ/AtpI family protein [Candidatus Omnitrophica bacterium]|nr:AtpZ/AtpI family protein [Candidatus Omnitrophota bacterium]